jgi:DNA-binding NarL/FixJ family response regulator
MKSRIEKLPGSVPENRNSPSRVIRAFLAEDSPLLMAWLARIVCRDARITLVGSAPDGRKAFNNASVLVPDLVVTDLNMPGMNGAEVARRLKQLPNPPIIFVVTGDNTPETRAICLAAGADAFLVKGGNLAFELLSAIQKFFPDQLVQNTAEPKHLHESFTQVE